MADAERERRHHAAAYHPVLSDEPIEILQPRRRMIKIALINALAIITSGRFKGYMSRKTIIWRRWYCARAVPDVPIEAPMIAAGFPSHALSP